MGDRARGRDHQTGDDGEDGRGRDRSDDRQEGVTAGIFTTLFAGSVDGVFGALLAQPAMVSVPVAFATMAAVSVRDPDRPRDVESQMLALHAPEELGLEALRP
jgi:hypothetical protein